MRRLVSYFTASLLTFVLGVAAAWGYGLLTGPRPDRKVRITLQRILMEDGSPYAEFRAVNGSAYALRYLGYDKDNHCSYSFRRGFDVKRNNPCTCGNGRAERTLHPGESATYQVSVRGEAGEFEVGFDFSVGKERRTETVWSENVVRLGP
jgi:hypothetical protein